MQLSRLRTAGHTPSLVAALLHFDVSFMVWVLLGALGPIVAKDLQLTTTQKALMVALPPLGGAAFRLLIGSLVDRVGIKVTGLVTLAATLVPLLWGFVGGGTYAQVLGIGFLLGVAGASFAVALPLASRWYPPEHQGLALGIAGAGNSGTIIAALAAPRIAEHIGWHATFGVATIPVGLCWIAFALLAREPAKEDSAAPTRHALAMLNEADARWFGAFYLVTFGGFVGFSSYLPIFFSDRFGLTPVTAASYAALCALAGSLLRPIGGALADRLGGVSVLAGTFAAVAIVAAMLATLPPLAATVALMFVLLGSFGVGNGAVFQLVGRRFPHQIGAVTGLVGAAGGLGGFLLPFGLGALASRTGSFAVGFAALASVGVLVSLALRARERIWTRSRALEVAI